MALAHKQNIGTLTNLGANRKRLLYDAPTQPSRRGVLSPHEAAFSALEPTQIGQFEIRTDEFVNKNRDALAQQFNP